MAERPQPDQVYRPADELAQREEIGGTDECGVEYPQTPVPVQPVGIVLARPTAPLHRVSGSMVLAASQVARVVGPTPQRRRLLICASLAVRLGDDESVTGTSGYLLPASTPHTVIDTGEVWVYAPTIDTVVSWWHDMDMG